MENLNRHQIISGSSLEGTDVRTPSDENIGNVKDIMIDLSTGEISYVVLSVSTGFLNLESKYFAVPLEAFGFDNLGENYHHDNFLVLDVSKEKLENSPGFDKDNWPTHPDSTFVDSVRSYYGIQGRNESSKYGNFSDSNREDARSSDSNLEHARSSEFNLDDSGSSDSNLNESGIGESRLDDMRNDNIRL